MARQLFLGEERLDTPAQVARLLTRADADERAHLLAELWAMRVDLGSWCAAQVGFAQVTAADGRTVAFSDIASADEAVARAALAALAGCEERELCSAAETPPASLNREELVRARVGQLDWYGEDRLDDVEDWERVACTTEELHGILRAIAAQRREGAEPVQAVVHVCHMGEGTSFDVLGLRFEHVRFQGHGSPLLVMNDVASSWEFAARSLDAVPGLSIHGCRIQAACALRMLDKERFVDVSRVRP